MKNRYYLTLYIKTAAAVILFSAFMFGQVPNGGFENWTNGNPDNWSTTNNPQFSNITQSTDAHSGSYSVKGTVASISGFSVAPALATEFPYSERPANFSGYYKFTSVSSDTLVIGMALYKNGVGIAGAIFHTTANANSYTQFSIPLTYITSDTPDSAGIGIYIGPVLGSHSGSTFFIDDLSFSGGATAVNENSTLVPDRFELMQNYPNPFNPSTTIEYQIPKQSFVSLNVYDILGNQVAELVNENKPAGRYSINFNAANLTSGVYFYTIEAGSFVQTKKLILIK